MDKLLNEFTVDQPIAETWAVLTDVERIAPCMPGATLEEIEGDIYRGVVKVKLGAISAAFRGQASFVERDDVNHRAVLRGEGRDTTGKGNADALITASLEQISPTQTKCVVETDLRITGKVAQFGRGIMGDVSKKLITQFATNLNTMLADSETAPVAAAAAAETPTETPAAAADTASPAGEPTAAATGGASAGGASAAGAGSTDGVRKINGPANEPIELSDLAGNAVLKRVLPIVGGIVLLLLVLRLRRRR
jgi:carbon monoxide dehydrogenase subunit G